MNISGIKWVWGASRGELNSAVYGNVKVTRAPREKTRVPEEDEQHTPNQTEQLSLKHRRGLKQSNYTQPAENTPHEGTEISLVDQSSSQLDNSI